MEAAATVMEEFGRRMRARRESLDLTQEDLARVSGLHRTYVGSVERGQRNLSLVNIVRIAEALQIDPGRLVYGVASQRRHDVQDLLISA